MKTQAQVLEKKLQDRPDCKDDIGNLTASIDRSAQMVTQLLAFARLQNIRQLHENIDLSMLVTDVLKDIFPAVFARHQTLETAIDPNLSIKGHAVALQTLVRNLVDNAIKYTPEGGRISIDLKRRADMIVLRVSDNGPGIPAEYRDKVFERFYRLHKGKTIGSGLGLSMVKWVADIHHAHLSLKESPASGLLAEVIFSEIKS